MHLLVKPLTRWSTLSDPQLLEVTDNIRAVKAGIISPVIFLSGPCSGNKKNMCFSKV